MGFARLFWCILHKGPNSKIRLNDSDVPSGIQQRETKEKPSVSLKNPVYEPDPPIACEKYQCSIPQVSWHFDGMSMKMTVFFWFFLKVFPHRMGGQVCKV